MQPVGNEPIKHYLEHAVASNSLGNCLLFTGCDGVGKSLFARSLAEQVLCSTPAAKEKFHHNNHPDFHLYQPEGKLGMHSMDSMRRFCEEVYLFPNESPKKVFVLLDAERMLPTSANALLKTLEEPAENSLIILVSAYPERLLPTIISRTQRLYFQPLTPQEMHQALSFKVPEDEQAALIARARGSVGQALQLWHASQDRRMLLLYQLLSGEFKGRYPQFQQALKELFHDIEKDKQHSAETIPEDWDASAYQREVWKKSQEGARSLHGLHTLDHYFRFIAFWFRDLSLLKEVPEGHRALYHQNEMERLKEATQNKQPPLREVIQALRITQDAILRAMKAETCFEAMCLKLGLV